MRNISKRRKLAMNNQQKIGFWLIALLAVVALGGCSSTTAERDAPSTATANSPLETKKQFISKPVESPATSSLEARQSGESTATPAASPLKEIYFDFDGYGLRADARATLKANGDWLKANPSAVVQIEGHCDERSTAEYNLALGAKRAQAAKAYLATLGIAAERLSTISYGEELPQCTEHTEECWQKNRRARFVIQPPRPAA
jgi:peptidoglycan-associated lipoprotein